MVSIEKIIEFLNKNGVSFSVSGSYGLPNEVLIRSIKEFIEKGDSSLIKNHRTWTYGNWEIDDIKKQLSKPNFPYDADYLREIKKTKLLFNDTRDLTTLETAIYLAEQSKKMRESYDYRRNNGFTNSLKSRCKKRDGYLCKRCGSSEDLEVDHIVEVIDGGENTLENLQTLCKNCHLKKTKKEIKKRKI